jgi:hypothetical protein
MSTKPNHRRETDRIEDHGPHWEANGRRRHHKPDAPSVARARKSYRRRAARKERRTGKPVNIIVPGRQRRRPKPLPTE